MAAAKKASENRTARAAKSQATRIQTKENQAAANERNAILKANKIKQASNRRQAAAERRGTVVINNRNKPVNKPTVNFNNKPNMQSFKLYLSAGNVTNETVKNLLNRITYNQNRYYGTNKQTIRNVLNKVIRLNKNDNLNRKARNLKSTMFATNNRQTRSSG